MGEHVTMSGDFRKASERAQLYYSYGCAMKPGVGDDGKHHEGRGCDEEYHTIDPRYVCDNDGTLIRSVSGVVKCIFCESVAVVGRDQVVPYLNDIPNVGTLCTHLFKTPEDVLKERRNAREYAAEQRALEARRVLKAKQAAEGSDSSDSEDEIVLSKKPVSGRSPFTWGSPGWRASRGVDGYRTAPSGFASGGADGGAGGGGAGTVVTYNSKGMIGRPPTFGWR